MENQYYHYIPKANYDLEVHDSLFNLVFPFVKSYNSWR